MVKNALTGMAGVYAVAAELSLRDYVVAVTSRNAPGVDILAVALDLGRTVSVQVKANRPGGTRAYWLLSKRSKADVSPSLFYVFVNLNPPGQRADFYIVSSRVVARDIEVERRKRSVWYSFRRDEKYRDQWDALL
jgi:hypothetical protein